MTPLTLTDSSGNVFTFQRFEIPEVLPFGGTQRLSVHEYPGGGRSIDAIGYQPKTMEWTGELTGPNAVTRGRYLETQMAQGTFFTLGWSEFSYEGVIAEFTGNFMQEGRIPYTIRFEPETDLTQPVNIGSSATVDQAILGDMSAASALGTTINDGVLSGLLSTLNSAISAVSSFAHAAQSVIASVTQPLAEVQQRVQVLIASSENTIKNITTFGGLVPNNPVAQQAAGLSNTTNAFTQSAALYNLNSVVGRMGGNLTALSGPSPDTKTVTVTGGTLYGVAAQEYGDATQWQTIGDANGISDPVLQGVVTLKIPPAPPGTKPQVPTP
ncbi:MAG TPA: hypothetical protein VGH91_04445 [Gammaproteobacteria bacterium]